MAPSLVILLVVGAALAGVTVATARAPRSPVPDLAGYRTRWSDLHEGFDPAGNRWVSGWLRVTYGLGRPLARAGVAPNLLTLWTLWLAFAVVIAVREGNRWTMLAAPALIVLSAVVDGLDGCVAALTDRATRWGYVLDSVVDRVSDALYLVAVWAVGGAGWLALLAGALGWLQEYVRARAGAAGLHEVGVVTVAERPTRVILTAGALLGAITMPDRAEQVATAALAALAVLAAVALVQVLVHVRRRLAG